MFKAYTQRERGLKWKTHMGKKNFKGTGLL